MKRVTIDRPHRARIAIVLFGAIVLALLGPLGARRAAAVPIPGKPPHAAATNTTPTTVEQALSQAAATGAAVNVDGATTPTDTLAANPDGTLTLTRSAEPVRRLVNQSWADLDATLKPNSDGTVSPTTTTDDLTMSGGGGTLLATISSGDKVLSVSAPFTLPAPSLSGATASYAAVLPGVDLQVTATTQGGLSEVLVVHDATAAANPALASLTFTTQTSGVSLSTDATGNLTASDQRGQPVFTAPAPLMWDSTAPASAPPTNADPTTGVPVDANTDLPINSSAAGPGEAATTTTVATSVGATGITLAPDQNMLTSASTQYPVYIDPTINPNRGGWATVAAGTSVSPATKYWNASPDPQGFMQVGYAPYQENGQNKVITSRTLINFPIATARLAGATITSARMFITEIYSWSCSARTVNLYAPSATLTASNANWNSWSGANLGGVVASANIAYGHSASCPAASVGFDVKSAITGAVASGRSTQTFALVAASESDSSGWKKFKQTSPTLSITYDHPPATPTGLSTSPATSCAASTPTNVGDGAVSLFAPVYDPDGGNLGVAFQLWQTASPSTILLSSNPATFTYSSGTTAVLIASEPTLRSAAGNSLTEFSWRVQVTDGQLTSNWSTTCNFNFDPTRTGPPAIAVPSGLGIGTTATFSITPPTTGTLPSGYLYQLNGGPPSQVDATNGDASIDVRPTRFTNSLTVTSLSTGGNIGDSATAVFNAAPAATAADGDLTGDNLPDLLAVGSGNMPPGLWQAAGRGSGAVGTAIVDIGANGNGIALDNSPTDFRGAEAITGHFTGTGMQDVLVYYPGGANAGGGAILNGDGDGSVLQAQLSGNAHVLSAGNLTDLSGDSPLQVANAGNGSGQNLAYPDLIAVNGDAAGGYQLDYYPSQNGIANYQFPTSLGTRTPTGGTDWNTWTIATCQVKGQTSMFLWRQATGELYLWNNVTFDLARGTLGYTQTNLATGWNPGAAITLHAADINGDGTADLWTVDSAGNVTTWFSSITGSTGTVSASPSQGLATGTHAWAFGDAGHAANGSVGSAADTIAGSGLTATGNVAWHTGDLFDPDIQLNTDQAGTTVDTSPTGVLAGSGPLIDTTKSFSLAVWAKPTAAGGAVVSEDGAHSSRFILWDNQSDNTWRFGMATGDTTAWSFDTATDPSPAQLGVWSLLVATYNADSGTMTLYVDDAMVASAHHTAAVSWPSTGNLTVGDYLSNNTHQGYYAGQIHGLQVWNSGLTTTQAGTTSANSGSDFATPVGAVTWTPPGGTSPETDTYTVDSNGLLWRHTSVSTPAKNLGGGLVTIAQVTFTQRQLMATGWDKYTSFGIADWNHDGYPDFIVRDNTNCNLYLYTGAANDLSATPILIGGGGWCAMRPFGVADLNHDGHFDMLAVETASNIEWIYPGDLTGGGGPRIQFNTGWTSDFTSFGITDLNGDGYLDQIVTHSGGALMRIPGDLTGGTTSGFAFVLLTGVTGLDPLAAFGDFTPFGFVDLTGDGNLDIFLRYDGTTTTTLTNGDFYVLPGTGKGSATTESFGNPISTVFAFVFHPANRCVGLSGQGC